mgnify:FL=1
MDCTMAECVQRQLILLFIPLLIFTLLDFSGTCAYSVVLLPVSVVYCGHPLILNPVVTALVTQLGTRHDNPSRYFAVCLESS